MAATRWIHIEVGVFETLAPPGTPSARVFHCWST